MADPIQNFSGLVTIALILGAYGLALGEWWRCRGFAPHGARLLARRWGAAAVVLLTVFLVSIRAGADRQLFERILRTPGTIFLFQSVGLFFLIPIGAVWAHRLDRRSLRGFPRTRSGWLEMGISLGALFGLSALLFLLTPHRPATDITENLGLDQMGTLLQLCVLVSMLALAPILEEALFRHYLLYRLLAALGTGPASTVTAVILTSLAWSVGHLVMVDPWWLKFAQIFLIGLVMGGIALRHGLQAAILLHLVFNLSLVPLALLLNG